MAGDWIAIRSALISSPKLIRMSRLLLADDFQSWAIPGRNDSVTTLCNAAQQGVTLSLLVAAWSYAREHGKDDDEDLIVEHMTCDDLDDVVGGAPGFSSAMVAVGWLEEVEGGLKFPNFREFNPRTNADRQREYRKRKRDNGVTTDGDATVTPTRHNTTQHNTTTDKEAPSSASSPPADASPVFIELELNDKTTHPVTERDVAAYAELYPAVDVRQQLRNMRGWLHDNPTKRKTRRGIRQFIGTWLRKEQDRGGSGRGTDQGKQQTGKIGRALAAVGGGGQ